MGERKIKIEANEEQIATKMKAMLNEVEENDSLMLIRIRQDGEQIETSSVNALKANHLAYLKRAFEDSFEEQLRVLSRQSPVAAAMVLGELMDSMKEKD